MTYVRGMKGWGFLITCLGIGLAVVPGCGGRTGALDTDLYGDDDDGSVAGTSVGGSRAGGPSRAGTGSGGSSRPVGGSAPVGGTASAGTSFGGTGIGGFVTGGTFTGGTFSGGASTGGFGGGSAGFGAVGGFVVGGAGGTGPLDCEQCLRNSCTPELTQCFQDFGCISIFGCMATTGCNAFQCYTPQFCKDTIDMFGGPAGGSMNKLLQVFTCGFNSGCQCG